MSVEDTLIEQASRIHATGQQITHVVIQPRAFATLHLARRLWGYDGSNTASERRRLRRTWNLIKRGSRSAVERYMRSAR